MSLDRITLVDRRGPLASAWERAFEGVDAVRVVLGDLFDHPADAMVSPANSFGIMDGGIDRAIRDRLGFDIERAAQQRILERHHGELPVGSAEVLSTGRTDWAYLVVAPTMRVPESVAQTVNAYLAFRAVLLAIRAHETPISSLVCPGLATGVGAMEPGRCAVQMRLAYDQVTAPGRIASYERIHAMHRALRGA